MSHATFDDLFTTSCLSVSCTIAVETGWFFGMRLVYGVRNAMAWTGFLASLFTAIYCVHELCYYFVDVADQTASCAQFKAFFILRGASNSLAFLHLFLRANAVNSLNPKWPPWRRAGIALTVVTLGVLALVAATRGAKPTASPPHPSRCQEFIAPIPATLKWTLQLICHIAFAGFFIWPLLGHMRMLRKAGLAQHPPHAVERCCGGCAWWCSCSSERSRRRSSSSAQEDGDAPGSGTPAETPTGFTTPRHDTVYRQLVLRAVVSVAASALFTVVAAVLVMLDVYGVVDGIPVVGLSILDNGFTLGSIFFANSGGLGPHDRRPSRQQRRRSAQQRHTMSISKRPSMLLQTVLAPAHRPPAAADALWRRIGGDAGEAHIVMPRVSPPPLPAAPVEREQTVVCGGL
ncbi:hypothetical protein JKP88DRAFT_347662 [Tribonema minus]|uniref:Uncharacterized protein n=1 Tax=Tribonema minus TaxID=303371 RepID=A0A835Z9W2_9STRA|nr:hypothetical protein JKP88DRAFT_347662 [Tribonema minus]